MALRNFCNLNEKRKKIIFDALLECLKDKNYENITINDIAKKSGISRGSFYNYFLDKNDAVKTLVALNLAQYKKIFVECIKEENENLFVGARKSFDIIKNSLKDSLNIKVVKNLNFINDIMNAIVFSKEYEEELDSLLDWLIENTIEGREYLNTRKKMANILLLLITTFISSIVAMINEKEISKKYVNFDYRLSVIEAGAKNCLVEV